MATMERKKYKARATWYLVLTCIVASIGGFNFGYAVGTSETMTYMNQFLNLFEKNKSLSNTCTPGVLFQVQFHRAAFASSTYLAGFISCFAASFVTQIYGRRASIIIGGFGFLVGALLTAAAQNMPMLILGRIMIGAGVGFGNQAIPIYLTEMGTPKHRGALSIMFQLAITIGILCAILINDDTLAGPYGESESKILTRKHIWRLPLGFGGVPAILMIIGAFILPETPNSLIERGQYEQGRRLLTKLRGTHEIDAEYEVIKEESRRAKSVQRQFRTLVQRQNRPQLSIALFMPVFQQLTGITPMLFYHVWQKGDYGIGITFHSSVMASVNVFATLITMANVDRWGRRIFFLEAGFQMFACLVAMGIESHALLLSPARMLLLLCVYISAFAWSWGPLGWLLPSEVFQQDTRSAGQALTVSINMLISIVIAHAFAATLCKPRWRPIRFYFFAAWVFVMTAFVFLFVPETKKVPVEEINKLVWRRHWFWKRFIESYSDQPAESSLNISIKPDYEQQNIRARHISSQNEVAA